MMRSSLWSSSLVLGALLAPLAAQSLELDVVGGSLPGPLTLDAHPGLFPFELMLIVPSTTAGPTPVQLFDPNDFRSLDIGIDLLGSAFVGVADLNLNFQVAGSLPAQPSLQDVPLFFQAVTFSFGFTLLDRISNGNVIRFADAGTFRDRFVSFNDERAFATVLPRADRTWMVVGGGRGQLLAQVATDTTSIYEPVTDTFSAGPLLMRPRSLHTATELADGRWLIAGGVNFTNDPQAFCEIYDPVADTFTSVASMNSPRMGHTATLLADGRVFASGGLEALTVMPTQLSAIRDTVDSTEIYDPVANTWTLGPVMSDPRAGHVALVRPNGTILLAGGISWDPVIIIGWLPAVRTSCDVYDPVTNLMSAGPSMSTPRALVDPVEIGPGRWLLAGGMNGLSLTNPGNPTAAAEIYDSTTNAWTTVGSMATARANHKAWALGNGQFLLAGGGAGSILSPTPLSSTEIFSTATNSFTPGPSLNVARAGAAAYLTPQGQMMLFGGASAAGSIVNTTEWYYY